MPAPVIIPVLIGIGKLLGVVANVIAVGTGIYAAVRTLYPSQPQSNPNSPLQLPNAVLPTVSSVGHETMFQLVGNREYAIPMASWFLEPIGKIREAISTYLRLRDGYAVLPEDQAWRLSQLKSQYGDLGRLADYLDANGAKTPLDDVSENDVDALCIEIYEKLGVDPRVLKLAIAYKLFEFGADEPLWYIRHICLDRLMRSRASLPPFPYDPAEDLDWWEGDALIGLEPYIQAL